jgi:hypothetical protein
MNSERLTTLDRRGARAMGSQPAPLLVLARYGRLTRTGNKNQRRKTIYTKSFTKPLAVNCDVAAPAFVPPTLARPVRTLPAKAPDRL